MKQIKILINKFDNYQRKKNSVGFFYAVIKKYGQDNGAYQGAILTYYGLLSLFPLLIFITTLTQLLLKHNSTLKNKIATSMTQYFPIVGNELQHSIHTPTQSGVALVLSLLISLYGARGVANAFQYSLNSLWFIPKFKQPPFLKNIIRSLSIIVVGGSGLVISSAASAYISTFSHNLLIKLLASLLSLALLWLVFILLFKLAVAGNKRTDQVRIGALTTAIGLVILQTLGGVIMSHELKGLNSLYGTFALVVGLIFWIYLQMQVILYCVEIDVIKEFKLFPRSIQGSLTASDKLAYLKYAQASIRNEKEKVSVRFK
jgi:YihY family inner membrane protein